MLKTEPASPMWIEVKSEEVVELYTKRAAWHREKMDKCERALVLIDQDGDIVRSLTAVFGSDLGFAGTPFPFGSRSPSLDVKLLLRRAVDYQREVADRADWLAKHVAPNEKFRLDETTWDRLSHQKMRCGCGGMQVQAAMPLAGDLGAPLRSDEIELFG